MIVPCSIVSFYLLYVNGNAKKWLFLLLNGAQYAMPKMAVRSTQGGGCHPQIGLHAPKDTNDGRRREDQRSQRRPLSLRDN